MELGFEIEIGYNKDGSTYCANAWQIRLKCKDLGIPVEKIAEIAGAKDTSTIYGWKPSESKCRKSGDVMT
jgi:hypothetical protein